MRAMSLDERLGLDKYELDKLGHIGVDQSLCRTCASKPCLTVCPAKVYSQPLDEIVVAYENCLECGTCQIACNTGGRRGITWRYPRGGFGIAYRHG
jgi:ferredoxin like protein